MAQSGTGAISDTALKDSLPPKEPSPPPDAEDAEPPRKRPRTKAPPRPSPVPSAPQLPLSPSSQPAAQASYFPIHPLYRFEGSKANIKRPREIAHFSSNEKREYRDDESGIRYYCPPKIGADLKVGFEIWQHYEDEEDPHLENLLRALAAKEKRDGEKCRADFVTWRGMMTKILTAPFDKFAEFSMFATLHDGTIYIEDDFSWRRVNRAVEMSHKPPMKQNRKEQHSHEMMTYWGYKFETLSLIPMPAQSTCREVVEARVSARVSNYAQHCSIITTSFGPHSLILGGEVDGLERQKPSSPDEPIPWIELKTAEVRPPPKYTYGPAMDREVLKFERKLLKFWAQSFLLGVPKIIVGFRSKEGILEDVQEYQTLKIPGMVRNGAQSWDGNVCINFATAFLTYLKEVIKENGVYRIALNKSSGFIRVQKATNEGVGGIVSQEFLDWRAEMQGQDEAKRAAVP